MATKKPGRAVYIVDGSRTPFLKARGIPGPFTASDLAVNSGRQLLARQPFEPQEFDEVILGCIMPGADEANIARVVSLRLGFLVAMINSPTPASTLKIIDHPESRRIQALALLRLDFFIAIFHRYVVIIIHFKSERSFYIAGEFRPGFDSMSSV